MATKKIKPELYWIWEDEDDYEEGPNGPYHTVEEILAVAATDHDLHLHSFPVRPGGPLVAKIRIGKTETVSPSAKQITSGLADRVSDFLCEDLADVECVRYEMSGSSKQQQQNLKQLRELLQTWCVACLTSAVPKLIKPETHVVLFNPLQHRTLKLKRRLSDMDLSQPVMPEVQPALDALRKALDTYNQKP